LHRAGENLHQGGFAGAVVTDHAEHLAAVQMHTDAVKGFHRAVGLGDVVQSDQRHGSGSHFDFRKYVDSRKYVNWPRLPDVTIWVGMEIDRGVRLPHA
jgi:hypothetical protein